VLDSIAEKNWKKFPTGLGALFKFSDYSTNGDCCSAVFLATGQLSFEYHLIQRVSITI